METSSDEYMAKADCFVMAASTFLLSQACQATVQCLWCRLREALAELEARIQTNAKADMRNSGMASVNRKNAARNFENAFKNVGARPEGARTADDGVDPFSRRKTRPMNYWTTKRAGTEDKGALPAILYTNPPNLKA